MIYDRRTIKNNPSNSNRAPAPAVAGLLINSWVSVSEKIILIKKRWRLGEEWQHSNQRYQPRLGRLALPAGGGGQAGGGYSFAAVTLLFMDQIHGRIIVLEILFFSIWFLYEGEDCLGHLTTLYFLCFCSRFVVVCDSREQSSWLWTIGSMTVCLTYSNTVISFGCRDVRPGGH